MAEPGQQRAASSTRLTDDFGLMLQNQLVCVAVLALVAPAHSQDDAGLPEARRVIDFEKDVVNKTPG